MTRSNGGSRSYSSSRVLRSEANNGFYFLPLPPQPSAMTGRCTVSVLRAKYAFFLFNKFFKGIIGLERDPLGEQQQISTGVGVAVQRLREGGLDGE